MCETQIAEVDENFCSEYLSEGKGYQQLIEGFHQISQQSGSAKEVLDRVDIYLDMSDGMNYKVAQAEDDAGLLTDLVNLVSGEKAEYFRLSSAAGNEIEQLPKSIGGRIQTYVRSPENYNSTNNYAPLDVAAETIVRNHDRESVLITDGELANKNVKGVVDPKFPWAQTAFKQWLSEGNRLDFVVKTVKEERLFFIFFTPRLTAEKENSLIEAYLESTADIKKADAYHHLKFTLSDYGLTEVDRGRPSIEAGLSTTFKDWVVDYSLNRSLAQGFEHIHIEDEENFKNFLNGFEQGEYNEELNSAFEERNKLFYDLLFTNEFVNYQVADLEIKVKDFSGPFNDYINYLKCGQAKSVTFEDEEGKKQTYWCNPWSNCQDSGACVFTTDESGGRELKEVFGLHEESKISVDDKQFSTAKIAIKPAENFNVDEMYGMSHCRIDLYIKNVEYSEGRQNFDVLTWTYKNEDYTGVSESIRLAMRELKPQNKLIYTYYITFGLPY
ncbi:MAG: hypothetical protein SF052_08955 [Bacteroidia bacterium]|nr:hypothetical protein [Bacteroidia bacterium]